MIVFIDDILIYSKTWEEHEMHLGLVLELLKKEKLYVKFSKCKFWLQEEAPRTSSKVCSFLGLAGYHLRFIENFSKIAKSLIILTQKFLALPDEPEEFVVYCDTSGLGLGCVLMQRGKAIAYASGQLKIHEKNYTTQLGEELSMRQHRWIELFSDYDCEIRYHPGKANVVADALSRKERVKPKRIQPTNMTLQSSIKDKIPRPSGLLQQPEIPERKGERIAIDFVTKLPRTSSGHDTIWVIVDRLTKSAYFLPMRKDYKMDRLKAACDRQKSYADKKRKPLEFSVGEHVLLKVSPRKGVVPLDEIQFDAKLNFVEEPVEILECEFKKLNQSRIAIVKVWWNSKQEPEFMWERENQRKLKTSYRVDGGKAMFILVINPLLLMKLKLDENVANFWPEFGTNGKEQIKHASGKKFQDVLEEAFVHPLRIEGELYIGIPPGVESRLATITVDTNDFSKASQNTNKVRGSATVKQASSLTLSVLGSIIQLINILDVRQAIIPALNLHASARALTRYYAALVDVDTKIFTNTKTKIHDSFVGSGDCKDLILQDGKMGLGFGRLEATEGGVLGFGHAGFGGSTGYADINNRFAFGVTLNLASSGALTGEIIRFICSELDLPIPEDYAESRDFTENPKIN
nr:beta-lactamase/transpeptidase-like protein [Tanacetum cinerariifolium]